MKVGWYCRTWGDRALLPQGEEWQAYLEAETGALRGQAEEAAALAQAAQDQVSPPTPPPPPSFSAMCCAFGTAALLHGWTQHSKWDMRSGRLLSRGQRPANGHWSDAES